MRSFIFAIIMLTAFGCAAAPVNRNAAAPLSTVDDVDLNRYQGLWYEIARLPNRFEKNCEGVTAEYALREDGLISVVNTCRENAVDGKVKRANGRARVVDTESNAKLEVSFFGPFWGDYWILDLAEDYSLSLVGEPEGRYLWILSRTPTISDETRDDAIAKLDAMKSAGVDRRCDRSEIVSSFGCEAGKGAPNSGVENELDKVIRAPTWKWRRGCYGGAGMSAT